MILGNQIQSLKIFVKNIYQVIIGLVQKKEKFSGWLPNLG